MNKLKTLKDINKHYKKENGSLGCLYHHFERELREEAIKWIKNMPYKYETNEVPEFIMEFFNIKKEDLNEG